MRTARVAACSSPSLNSSILGGNISGLHELTAPKAGERRCGDAIVALTDLYGQFHAPPPVPPPPPPMAARMDEKRLKRDRPARIERIASAG